MNSLYLHLGNFPAIAYTPRVAARLRRKRWAARREEVTHAWGPQIDEAVRVFASSLQDATPFVTSFTKPLPPPRNGGVRRNPPVFGSVSDGEDAG
jgi:hypothetical protein